MATMLVEELLYIRRQLFEESDKIIQQKSRGYGSENDVLANFKLAEKVGILGSEMGAWLRLCDKVVRLGRMLKYGETYVGFESFLDTVIDAINYLTIVVALRYEKDDEFRERFNSHLGQNREVKDDG